MHMNDQMLAERYALFKAHIVDQMADNANRKNSLSKPLIVMNLITKVQDLKQQQAHFKDINNNEGKIMCLCLHSEIETIDALINHHITEYVSDLKALEKDQISLTVT